MKTGKFASVFAAFAVAGALNSQASVLVRWVHNFSNQINGQIEDVTGSVASAANTSTTGATGAYLGSGTIVNLPAGGGTGSGWDYVAPYAEGTANSQSWPNGQQYNASGWDTTPNTSKYITYELTMAGSIDSTVSKLEGIQFNLANGGTSGPRGVEVTYRIGTSGSFTSLGYTRVPNNTPTNYGLFTFNLPSPANLSAGDTVTFRLLGYANASGNSIRLDNVAITAIPEPNVAGLTAAGAGLFAMIRRIRRRNDAIRG